MLDCYKRPKKMGNSCIVDLFCYTCQTNDHLVLWEYCIHSSDIDKFVGFVKTSSVGGVNVSSGSDNTLAQLGHLKDHLEKNTVPDRCGFHKFFLCAKCEALVSFGVPIYVVKNKVSQIQDLDASW